MSRSLFTAGTAALSVFATVDATSYLKYSTVPGYFLQDIDTTSTDGFDYVRLYIWSIAVLMRQNWHGIDRDKLWPD